MGDVSLANPDESKLGAPIPYDSPHALSVSLPTWKDNIGWASGDQELIDHMATGYPRFFVHRTIQKLAADCLRQYGNENELCMLFPTSRTAKECFSYIERRLAPSNDTLRITSLEITQPPTNANDSDADLNSKAGKGSLGLHCVFFPVDEWPLAKQFWQHTGMGVSSRYAESCLFTVESPKFEWLVRDPGNIPPGALEEKAKLRRRIAKLAAHGEERDSLPEEANGGPYPTEDDVFLYPTGMSAIWHAHQLTLGWKPGARSVCFGFPYTDNLKILQKWGYGCYFYGDHPDANLAALETLLAHNKESLDEIAGTSDTAHLQISALFCECPSNPLLQTPDFKRLRELADENGFLICVDDTVGTFVNIDTLKYVDVVMTSLSKLFSGKANVMGGSLVINPKSKHYEALRRGLRESYVDDFYAPDAVQMEINSRDFASRVRRINENTRAVCYLLRENSLAHQESLAPEHRTRNPDILAIKQVFYPEFMTRENYALCQRPSPSSGNYGSLFSLTFTSLAASEAFYDTLRCAKGPSLGTNFTLACPYTILAHYWEREWAAGYGVEEGIVRVSIGIEESVVLMEDIRRCIEAAGTVGNASCGTDLE